MSALPSYTAEQLTGVLALLPDVDSVELKLSVGDQDRPGVVAALGIDTLDARVRQVAFIDTPDLRLSAAGVVVRARRTQRKPGDATVKLRPLLPDQVPDGLRDQPGFKVEVDASPAGYTCSCSLTAEVPDHKVKELYAGTRPLARVLGKAQLALLTARLPEDVGLEDLRVLGPLSLLKCKFAPADLPRPMVAELWFLPDGSRLLELSAKAAPADAFQAAAETKIFLAGHGVDLAVPQEAKTRTALAALAAALDKE
ncbi:hypothetical protein [Nocardioides sp. URHA0020]|uniref:hypothetical protein n=1 Tax=Nocardioides sp. URHA0020 TaxID=1380392 RepID=UPI00068872E9|nr:hypothetical protein [Nocardioides sp. URHA0020]